MLYYNFKNFEEFKELFGKRVCGNGNLQRQNKILLSVWKDKKTLQVHARGLAGHDWLAVSTMADLKSEAMNSLFGDSIILGRWQFASTEYETDEHNGVCQDGDANSIRYIRKEDGRVYKMRAGKFLRKILENSVTYFPESLKIWLCEEFAADWRAYAADKVKESQVTLHVDDNFEDIYSSDCVEGCFGSCMMDDGNWTFYRDAVDAKAAYLKNGNDKIVARCIIFNDVRAKGNHYRLAERQYSKDGDETLKRLLVNRLIEGGYIDGYKQVGAGCHDNTNFVDVNGNPLDGRQSLMIDCRLDVDETVSYQDTFVYFSIERQKASNNADFQHSHELDTTCGILEDERIWSEYENRYLDEEDAVWVESHDSYVSADETVYARNTCTRELEGDCIEISGDYYYAGYNAESPEDWGIACCPRCGEWFVLDDGDYSTITDEDYCSEYCRLEEEYEYKERNWEHSEYSDEYYEEGVITAFFWSESLGWDKITIHIDEFNNLVADHAATELNGSFYIDKILTDGEPAHLLAV